MMQALSHDEVEELMDGSMKLYEWIDRYIEENHTSIGERFMRGDIEAWAAREGHEFDVGSGLTSHRESPLKRTFTTKRVGMGRYSFYEIVEVEKGVWPKAVREMHQQIGREGVKRWANEVRFRMQPLAVRNKKAQDLLDLAEAEMTLVATIFDMKLNELLGDDEDEEGNE